MRRSAGLAPKPPAYAPLRHVTLRLSGELHGRLERWRRDQVPEHTGRTPAPQPPSRTAAIEELLGFALDVAEGVTVVPSSRADVILDDLAAVRRELVATHEDLRKRDTLLTALVDALAPHAIGVNQLLAHWMSKDPDVRELEETSDEAEERILEELDQVAAELWGALRRDAVEAEASAEAPEEGDADEWPADEEPAIEQEP